jgi:hypothetical protein
LANLSRVVLHDRQDALENYSTLFERQNQLAQSTSTVEGALSDFISTTKRKDQGVNAYLAALKTDNEKLWESLNSKKGSNEGLADRERDYAYRKFNLVLFGIPLRAEGKDVADRILFIGKLMHELGIKVEDHPTTILSDVTRVISRDRKSGPLILRFIHLIDKDNFKKTFFETPLTQRLFQNTYQVILTDDLSPLTRSERILVKDEIIPKIVKAGFDGSIPRGTPIRLAYRITGSGDNFKVVSFNNIFKLKDLPMLHSMKPVNSNQANRPNKNSRGASKK